MINPQDGSIGLESPPIVITHDFSREQFLSSPLFPLSSPLNQNSPWSRYSFRPITIAGEVFAADICFKSDRLYSVNLRTARPAFGESWSDWSSEKEIAAKRFHDSLLTSWFGSTRGDYLFRWGKVYSVIDNKSGSSSIGITYSAESK